jgi:hypothetical protein
LSNAVCWLLIQYRAFITRRSPISCLILATRSEMWLAFIMLTIIRSYRDRDHNGRPRVDQTLADSRRVKFTYQELLGISLRLRRTGPFSQSYCPKQRNHFAGDDRKSFCGRAVKEVPIGPFWYAPRVASPPFSAGHLSCAASDLEQCASVQPSPVWLGRVCRIMRRATAAPCSR